MAENSYTAAIVTIGGLGARWAISLYIAGRKSSAVSFLKLYMKLGRVTALKQVAIRVRARKPSNYRETNTRITWKGRVTEAIRFTLPSPLRHKLPCQTPHTTATVGRTHLCSSFLHCLMRYS